MSIYVVEPDKLIKSLAVKLKEYPEIKPPEGSEEAFSYETNLREVGHNTITNQRSRYAKPEKRFHFYPVGPTCDFGIGTGIFQRDRSISLYRDIVQTRI